MASIKKLLYLVSEDHYFVSHRFALAKAAIASGYEVHLATTVSKYEKQIVDAGIHLHKLESFQRASTHPLNQFHCLRELWQLYKKVNPDIVHQVAIKPVLYGSLIAIVLGVPMIVNALAGLGFVFISKSFKAKALRIIVIPLMRFVFTRPNQILIVQNQDDYALWLNKYKIKNIVLIRGSGVDIHTFKPAVIANKIPIILFPARMLWDKGTWELIEAARILKSRNVKFDLWFCGDIDHKNPSRISNEKLENWQSEGLIKWMGYQSDMVGIYQKADIVVLPSYREGLPKSLLEAAACGIPMVASDVPGCREIVIHEKTGLLVPVKESAPLADALLRLINDQDLCVQMGKAARQLVQSEFSDDIVISATLKTYQ